MGAILSLNSSSSGSNERFEICQSEARKRQRFLMTCCEGNVGLIPGLPDEVSIQILARVPRIYYLKMKLVCQAWKETIMSTQLFNVRKELRVTEEWLYLLTKAGDDKLLWYALDPVSKRWIRLPTMPSSVFEDDSRKVSAGLRVWNMLGSGIKIADAVRAWLGRKDRLDRMSYCGCAIGAVDGCLYVLGGFSKASAMRSVWRYNPILNVWNEVSPMSTGRAYCKTGILNNKLYVVGGVNRDRGGLTPLESAEVFDPDTGMWSQIPNMPFSKAQVLPTAFLADLLKPIATGMTSYNGKLFVAQSLYCWPFFVDVGGEVYDPDTNSWVDMPTGMGEGWPARQAGTKLSVTVDGKLYALDPSSSLESARIKVYDGLFDVWKVVVQDVPIRDFADSESPYLLAGLLGKLHVITKDPNRDITVLQVDVKNHLSSLLPSPSGAPDDSSRELGTDPWRVIASRRAGSAELVSCQTLDL
ncbi:hypothetical protein Tsubulata_025232 [Turnera subulata]|uniref:F-box domain-containing protein n=1 Tax=Turnera subulata TaxID=218843 RepID=A0A9Q0F4J6_9ROSI|nr:hypothetical protein Tsubulata_025232 [Turnera subulata]